MKNREKEKRKFRKIVGRFFFNPKSLTFFLLMPLMIVMPLALTSLFLGFPIPYYITNNELNQFGAVFNAIELPEGVQQIGDREFIVANIIDNKKIVQKEIHKEDLKALDDQNLEDAPAGSFYDVAEPVTDVTTEETDQNSDIKNGCDFLGIVLLKTTKSQDEISAVLLDSFMKEVEESRKDNTYELVFASQLKLLPVNRESTSFDIESYRIDLLKELKLHKNDITDGETYLLYMLNDNVNTYPDPRCK